MHKCVKMDKVQELLEKMWKYLGQKVTDKAYTIRRKRQRMTECAKLLHYRQKRGYSLEEKRSVKKGWGIGCVYTNIYVCSLQSFYFLQDVQI